MLAPSFRTPRDERTRAKQPNPSPTDRRHVSERALQTYYLNLLSSVSLSVFLTDTGFPIHTHAFHITRLHLHVQRSPVFTTRVLFLNLQKTETTATIAFNTFLRPLSRLFSSSPSNAATPAAMSAARSQAQKIIDENPVVVFSKSYCPYCRASKALLAEKGAKFYVMELDQIGAAFFFFLFFLSETYPQHFYVA